MLSDADVLEYQQLYQKKFNCMLSTKDARKRANGLVELLAALSQPANPSQIITFDRLGDSKRPEASVYRKVGLASRS